MKTFYRLFLIVLLLSLNPVIAETIALKSPAQSTPMAPAVKTTTQTVTTVTAPIPHEEITTPSSGKLWNLQDADIISVINEISQETGKNFVVDPRVQGKISLVSSKPIKPGDTYDVFLSILELLGYSAISSGNVVKIVPNLESSEMATHIATNQSPGKGDEVVVRVIPLEHVTANQLIPIIRPLLPQWSNVSAYPPGNVLILLGRAANIARIVEIIHSVDTASNNDIDIVPLRQASASQITNVLNNLQNASRANGETPTVFITADERSNSILLSGNKSGRLRMRLLISQLDTPTSGAQANTEVVYLRYLQAKTLAPILGKIAQNMLGKGGENRDLAPPSSSPTSSMPNAPRDDTNPATKTGQSKGNPAAENLTNVQAEPSTNALIITAPPSLMRALNSIVAKLDVRPAQVHVEAIIVEINQEDLQNLGIQWGSITPQGAVASTSASSPFTFPPLGAVGTVGIIPHTQIQAILSVLENKTGVDILSTPSIVVLDNQKAILQVGTDIPEQTGSYATTGSNTTGTPLPFTTISRQKVTLKLTVQPQINLGNSVRLKIDLINDSLQNPQNPGLTPIINTSTISNSVIVDSGCILVLGGLISNNITESLTKVPILGDLPIVGKLFQNKNNAVQKQNLVMFIKPVILHDSEDSTSITNTKYDQIRQVQVRGPLDLSQIGEQKRQNILPRWGHSAPLPAPFGESR